MVSGIATKAWDFGVSDTQHLVFKTGCSVGLSVGAWRFNGYIYGACPWRLKLRRTLQGSQGLSRAIKGAMKGYHGL